jgi:hypothetical protein
MSDETRTKSGELKLGGLAVCSVCSGTGKLVDSTCPECHGAKRITLERAGILGGLHASPRSLPPLDDSMPDTDPAPSSEKNS